MRCPYCHNPEIVLAAQGKRRQRELFNFLELRRGKLDGVVFSGGECTLWNELPELCTQVKSAGFKVKIDTNGSNPAIVRDLLKRSVVDYVALDYKAPPAKFRDVTGSSLFSHFSETLDLLIASDIAFEVRTTYHSDLLTPEDISEIANDLYQRGYTGTLHLQNFVNGSNTLGNPGSSLSIRKSDLPEMPLKIEIR